MADDPTPPRGKIPDFGCYMPTPEEIQREKEILREKHFAARRAERSDAQYYQQQAKVRR